MEEQEKEKNPIGQDDAVGAVPEVVQLQEELENSLRAREQLKSIAHRAQADLVNVRRRFEKESLEIRSRAIRELIEKLFPICDQLEIALSFLDSEEVDFTWVKGMHAVYKNLQSVLEEEHFRRFDVLGTEFDPIRHEAISVVPTLNRKDGEILRQIRSGYSFMDKVVRPAQVEISSRRDSETEDNPEQTFK